MDTKKVKILLVLSVFITLSTMNAYSQSNEYDDNMIEWKCKCCKIPIVFADTSQIIVECEKKYGAPSSYCISKIILLNGKQLFCCFCPVGSGLPIWLTMVYYRKLDNWVLIAEGTVTRYGFIIEKDSIIHTMDVEADDIGNRIIFKDNGKVFGELRIDSF